MRAGSPGSEAESQSGGGPTPMTAHQGNIDDSGQSGRPGGPSQVPSVTYLGFPVLERKVPVPLARFDSNEGAERVHHKYVYSCMTRILAGI